MADQKQGTYVRLGVLIVVLAAAGGFYMIRSSAPPKGGNLERIVLEDSANIISGGKTIDDVKKIFRHDSPEPGHEQGVYLFDFAKVDPSNTARIEVVVRGGKVIAMREFEGRIPAPRAFDTSVPQSGTPADPPADSSGDTGDDSGGN